MIPCALKSLEMLIILLSELIWVSNRKLALSEAIWSLYHDSLRAQIIRNVNNFAI